MLTSALSEHREKLRIAEEWFDNKLPKDFDDNVNDAIQHSTALNCCMRRSIDIYHKNHRDSLNVLLEKMKSRLSKKEERNACELDNNFDKNEVCDT